MRKEKIAPNHIHATEPCTIAMKDQQNPYKKTRTMKGTKWSQRIDTLEHKRSLKHQVTEMKPTQMITIKQRKKRKIELFLNRNHGLVDHVFPFAFVFLCVEIAILNTFAPCNPSSPRTVPCMS